MQGAGAQPRDERRRRWAAGMLLFVLLAVGLSGCSRRTPPPNVVLIVIDTLRADRMSLHGYEQPTTPRIEEFAATGVTFERAYSPGSWTRSSVASYFTGYYPASHGCELREDRLASDLVTLAELFKERGYSTVGIYSNPVVAPTFGFDQGFDVYETPPKPRRTSRRSSWTDAAAVNERIFRWLREERSSEPWFLFALYIDPHTPYYPHEEYWFSEARASHTMGHNRYLDRLMSEPRPSNYPIIQDMVRALYDSEIGYVDAQIGALLVELDSLGVADNTVVILTSDHGEALWEHDDYLGHGLQVYETMIHVPLVVRWPGRTQAGDRVTSPVEAFDLFGALVEGCGLRAEARPQCGSLLSTGEANAIRKPVLVQGRLDDKDYRVVVDGNWKLIHEQAKGEWELFDLATDPDELGPIARGTDAEAGATRRDDPTTLARLTAMRSTLDSLMAWTQAWHDSLDNVASPAKPSEALQRELEALGYVR